jgi:signal transduction histidine kinase
VVDDNAENLALARAALEDEDFEVLLASSGADALTSFERERPDCVLLDVRMPEMDGFEACTRIRALPGGSDTPIVFLTALRDVDTFDRSLLVGADDFLTKPVRPTELISRVHTALKLRRMSAELREHYELVRHQRDDLMRLQLQKERLMAFVVHDLKSPLSIMDLHAQVAAGERELPERARASIEHIREGARSLLRMILNLLDISKSEEGRLVAQRASVDLEALAGQLAEEQRVMARAAEVELELSIEVPRAFADVDLLRRVLENLIDNAIRHAPSRSVVRLSATRTAAGVELRVSDAGAGIPAELRERIFEPFVQAEVKPGSVTRTGRGLGLAFCKLAVEAHGGTLAVEDVAVGTTFCLRLPHEP